MTKRIRKMLDKAHTGVNVFAIFLLILALVIMLGPIFVKGIGAFIFKGTIEFRKIMYQEYNRGDAEELAEELAQVGKYRDAVFKMLKDFEVELNDLEYSRRSELTGEFKEIKEYIRELLGPLPDEPEPILLRKQYGQTRWGKAREKMEKILYAEEWDYSDPDNPKILKSSRKERFKGTGFISLFDYIKVNLSNMMNPKLTFYWNFLFDKSRDSHFFGGIFPEILGTLYLTLLAMLFAVPFGIIAAIYLTEFAREGKLVTILRGCVNTLAGVPSIVFGLFGLAFFINELKVSNSKSVLAGSLTLAVLVLPTIIRAAEEAILSVPKSYKEAAFGVGASHLRTIFTVTLPAALPGILTGIIISMGRAAGETAPIIFTAAVSVGNPLKIAEIFTQPTPALSWNIYNIATEHEAVDEIRHVQFGMVLTLILLVLTLNIVAMVVRAKISKKLRG